MQDSTLLMNRFNCSLKFIMLWINIIWSTNVYSCIFFNEFVRNSLKTDIKKGLS